jgi:hypothetical protein
MEKDPQIPMQLLVGTKSRKDLAKEYDINERTLYRWIKQKSIELPRRLLLPDEYVLIYQKIGLPGVPPQDDEKPPTNSDTTTSD